MSSPRRSLKDEQAEATRERLIDAAMTLLGTPGQEVSMRAVAKAAGTSERTIYRYFPALDELHAEIGRRLHLRAGAPIPKLADDLPAYVDLLFGRFEQNKDFVAGLVAWMSAQPPPHPSRMRNLAALRGTLDRSFPDAPEAERAAAAACLRALISGESWCYLRVSCELPEAEVRRAAHFALDAVFARLRAPPDA